MFKGFRFRTFRFRGFSLTENLIVFVLIGILAAIAAPSFGAMLDARKLDQSVTIVQTSLSTAHRQAIRDNRSCEVGISSNQAKENIEKAIAPSSLYIDCNQTQEESLSKKIIVVSNILPLENVLPDDDGTLIDEIKQGLSETDRLWCEKHKDHGDTKNHTRQEVIDLCFDSPEEESGELRFSQAVYNSKGGIFYGIASDSKPPQSSTGKIVLYNEGQSSKKNKCLAISKRLGLTRIGAYSGELDPKSITDSGECTARKWTQQYS